MFNEKPQKQPEFMTSAELERAIREHQEYVRKLLEEVAARRKSNAEQRKNKG